MHMQWLPYKWQFQWLFLVYRWAFAFYFLGWLIALVVTTGHAKVLIYLTVWALLVWVVYLLFAAVSATVRFFQVHVFCRGRVDFELSLEDKELIKKPKGCCGAQTDHITWYQKIHWLLFNVGTEMAFIVVVLYWSILYRGGEIDGVNANEHLTNGIIGLVDVWVSGTPIQILHFIYIQAFGVMYSVFSGVYFVANGTDILGNPYIYNVLDYGNNTALAVGLDVGIVVLVLPAVHLFWYLQYAIRFWLVRLINRKCHKHRRAQLTEEGIEMKGVLEEEHDGERMSQS